MWYIAHDTRTNGSSDILTVGNTGVDVLSIFPQPSWPAKIPLVRQVYRKIYRLLRTLSAAAPHVKFSRLGDRSDMTLVQRDRCYLLGQVYFLRCKHLYHAPQSECTRFVIAPRVHCSISCQKMLTKNNYLSATNAPVSATEIVLPAAMSTTFFRPLILTGSTASPVSPVPNFPPEPAPQLYTSPAPVEHN